MKKFLKFILLFSFVIATQNQFWQNMTFYNGTLTLIKVAVITTLFELFLKPIIKILLLPINLMTLGLIRLVINTFGLYLSVFLLSDFSISNISKPSFQLFGVSIPSSQFNGFWAFLINSISIGFIMSLFRYILKSPKIKK